MVKAEWGTKHTCQNCGAKFYDLKKTPAVCPKCGTEQTPEKPRLKRASAPQETKAETPAPEATESEDVEEDDIEADDGIEIDGDEDDGILGDDAADLDGEDDVAGVVDTVDGDDEDKS